jgi:hypothetical protein
MHGDQFRAVGKGRLDLHFRDHLADAVHYVVARQHGTAKAHDLGDALALARQFQQMARNQCDGFGVVQFQAALFARAGELGGDEDQQFIALLRRQVHGRFAESVRGYNVERF